MNPAPYVDEIVGRFAAASNATLLGRSDGELVIYKPSAGNRPLWDFDVATLADREVLVHDIAEALGFVGLVPHTVLGTGEFGPGAVQRYLEPDPDFDPIRMIQDGHDALWPVAVLDLVVNNADRKAGHLLLERETGALRAIDHGLCLHHEPKLRTVLWAFARRSFPQPIVEALGLLARNLRPLLDRVDRQIGPQEATALKVRVETLLEAPLHPGPPDDRPAVPWPPY